MATVSKSQVGLLPHNIEAEEAVLGSLLMDPDAILRVRDVDLVPADFFRESNRYIFGAIMDLADAYTAVDPLTVADALRNRQNGNGSQLDAIGGESEFTRLVMTAVTSVNAKHYAGIVKDNSRRRALIRASAAVAQLAQEHEGGLDALFDQVSQTMFDAMDRPEEASHLYGTDDTLVDYLAGQDARRERLERDPNARMKTYLAGLDYLLDEIEPAALMIIGARSSVGKTMMLEQVTEANARHGHRVAYYHLEQTHSNMLDRRMARHSGIEMRKLRTGYRGPEVTRALDDIREWQRNIIYVHCPGWTAKRIAGDITRLHAKDECELAVVDYLQKIKLLDAKQNAAMAIGNQAETLKSTAEILELPVILGSQVSRFWKGTADKRPTMDDIRNSGEVPEKANQIIMLHREGEREQDAVTETIKAYVEKNTNGPCGECELVHVLGRFMLSDPAREHAAPPEFGGREERFEL